MAVQMIQPPHGIANVLLRCGHQAQMKRGHYHLKVGGFTWCEECHETRAIVERVS